MYFASLVVCIHYLGIYVSVKRYNCEVQRSPDRVPQDGLTCGGHFCQLLLVGGMGGSGGPTMCIWVQSNS